MNHKALITLSLLLGAIGAPAAMSQSAAAADDIRMQLIEHLRRAQGVPPAPAQANEAQEVEVVAAPELVIEAGPQPEASVEMESSPAWQWVAKAGQWAGQLNQWASSEQLVRQLDELITEAGRLSLSSDDAGIIYRGLCVQMQAIYLRLMHEPAGPEVDRLLGRLRTAARRTKALTINSATAQAEGDFWLLTADLFDLNRSGLPIEAQQQQASQLLGAFLALHDSAPMARHVRAMHEALQNKGQKS